jgi:hypothetical protein
MFIQLLMINQEPGAMPGEPLTAVQTFTYFVAAPVGLFIGISFLVWAFTREKAPKNTSSITHIE